MDVALRPGHTWRRPRADDAEAFFDLVATHNTAVIGFADFTLDDARDQLTEPGFDPDTDGWLVHDPAGELIGFGWVFGEPDSDQVEIEIITDDEAVADWLLAQILTRAGELAAAAGHGAPRMGLNIYRDDAAHRAWAEARGFTPATTFHRMRIDHDGPVEPPVVPDGVVVRVGPGDEALRRDAHRVLMASFADHFGWVQIGFDEWHERVSSAASDDWAQLKVAYVDGAPAAMELSHNGFVEDDDCGYVRFIGVLTEYRGRGLARLLLQQAFADDAERGRQGTLLHVDTNNTTPALGLYLGLGMRPVLVVDVWLLSPETRPPA